MERSSVLSFVPDEGFWSVLMCAVRGCLFAENTIPLAAPEWIMEHLDEMPDTVARVMLGDILKHKAMMAGFADLMGDPAPDMAQWNTFETWLRERFNRNQYSGV